MLFDSNLWSKIQKINNPVHANCVTLLTVLVERKHFMNLEGLPCSHRCCVIKNIRELSFVLLFHVVNLLHGILLGCLKLGLIIG